MVQRLLGLVVLAPACLARAGPLDPQQNSLQSAVDSFVAYLKTESNEAMTAAVRMARENKHTLEAAKARIDAAIAAARR
jgi:tellurite resistance protein